MGTDIPMPLVRAMIIQGTGDSANPLSEQDSLCGPTGFFIGEAKGFPHTRAINAARQVL